MMLREEEGREARPSAVSIDSQSIKKAPFVSEETGIDVHRGAETSGSTAESVIFSPRHGG